MMLHVAGLEYISEQFVVIKSNTVRVKEAK